MRKVVLAVRVAVAAVLAGGAGPVSLSADDVIAGRQAGFDLQGGVMTAMKAAIDAGQPVSPFEDGANGLAAWAKAIPSQFPDGTQAGHDTKAKPEIWADPAGFAKAASAMGEAAAKLAVLAKADDRDGFAAQFGATGKMCGACHRGYRVKRE